MSPTAVELGWTKPSPNFSRAAAGLLQFKATEKKTEPEIKVRISWTELQRAFHAAWEGPSRWDPWEFARQMRKHGIEIYGRIR